MISIISDHVFDDSTESRAKSRTVEQSDSDSDQDEPPQRQVQVKGDSKQGLSKFFDKVLQTAASDEDDDAANEVFSSKLVDLLPKFDKVTWSLWLNITPWQVSVVKIKVELLRTYSRASTHP
jgi:hypothetical protein